MIRADSKISDIMRDYPELTDLLLQYGLCECAFGPKSALAQNLEAAAAEKGLNLAELLAELNARIGA